MVEGRPSRGGVDRNSHGGIVVSWPMVAPRAGAWIETEPEREGLR
jgi:hypothetical protein